MLNNAEALKTILSTFNAPHEAVLIADEHERILHFNPAAEKMFGLTATQTLGLKLNQLIAPQTNGKRAKTKVSGLLELARAQSVPFLGRHSTGKHLLLEAFLKQTETEGKTMYALMLRRLIAPAKTADGNSTVEMRATIFNAAYEFLGLLQPDGALLDANSAALDFVGVTLADVKGRPFGETPWWAHDEVGRAQLQAGIAAAARGEFVRFEARHHGALGDEITVDFSLKPVRDRHGAIILLVPEGRDITERKQHEAALQHAYDELERKVQERTAALLQAQIALQANEARFACIINSAMDAIISVDEHQKIVLFNPAAEKMFGYQNGEMIGQPLERLLPAGLSAAHAEHIRRFSKTGETARAMEALGAVSGVRQTGEEFPIEAAISQMETGGRKLYTVILRDITHRREAEKQLREQAALLNQAREAIISSDLKGHIQFWNHGAEQVYGWMAEEVIGRNLRDLVHRNQPPAISAESERAKAALATGEWHGELRHFTKTAREITVDCHISLVRDDKGQPASFLIINSDITEQKQLEAQLLRAQRMESIGTLAGGIAHDLNNILSPLSMGLQMMQMKYTDEYAQKMLGMMSANVQRGAEMVKQILQFARGISGERISVQLKHIAKDLLKLLAETFPKSITLKQKFAENPALVLGDATQLHQVLLNLCINARDAMPNGGTLTIGLENIYLNPTYPPLAPDAKPGPYVVLSITDTGEGITPENLARIFDPFFTTKDAGKGTGLGLSTVFGIVRAHDGFITVASEPGRGAQFKVYLPALATPSVPLNVNRQHTPPAGQGELILVVDDESAIREMSRAALEAWGYRVLTAENGAAAVALYAQRQDEVQLVITDLQMPKLGGTTLISLLRQINPQSRIICCTGSADAEQNDELARLGIRHFLPKPLNVEALLHAIAQALHDT
ncbi:MAG: PAS domain S-box protein [Acidobacteria bacterium]|nr:PAS domain S-box protein [Acidobacteriota bacterium]